VSCGKSQSRFFSSLGHFDQFPWVARAKESAGSATDRGHRADTLDTGNTFDDQIFTSDRTSLVETTNVDSTSKWDSEWFSAKDG
jgi:hypothetical protein